MPQFKVIDDRGNALTLEGDSEPTEQELEEVFKSLSGNSPIDQEPPPPQTVGDFYDPNFKPAELPLNLFEGSHPQKEALQRERLNIAAENEGQNIYDYAAVAHTGISKGLQGLSTLLQSAYDIGQQLPSTKLARGIGDVTMEAVLPEGPKQAIKEIQEDLDSDKYFKGLAEWEKWMSDRDALLGAPTFGTQLTEAVSRGFAELPVQMLGGVAGGAGGSMAAAVRGSAIGAGTTAGLQQYAQEMGEGADRLTAAGRGATSGLITGLTTSAFGATGVESIWRNEGVKGVINHLKRALVEFGYEFSEESIDQIQQDLLMRIQKDPNKPIGDSVREVLLAGFTGGILGGGIGAISGGGERTAEPAQRMYYNQPGEELRMPMQIEGGETDASQEQEAAAVHGDVREQLSATEVGEVPVKEGGAGVQQEAQKGVLSPDDRVRHDELFDKFISNQPLTSEERNELDQLDATASGQVKGFIAQADEMINEALKEEGVSSDVEIADVESIKPGSIESRRLAWYDTETGKITINGRAMAQDMANLPPEQRKAAVRAVINEEWVHSHTTREMAKEFASLSWGIEKTLARKIYTGNKEGMIGGKAITDEALGFEIIRRRIQRLNRMTPTEIAASVGKERWTNKQLDMLDNVIAIARRNITVGKGRRAAKSQLEMLNRVQGNIKAARRMIESGGGEEIAAPRREVQDLVSKLDARKERVSTDEAVQAGLKAESIEDLDALAEGWRQWKSDLDDVKKRAKSDPSVMMQYAAIAQRGQLYREAIEAATNSGSHKVEARVGTEKDLPPPTLDYTKNPEVEDWLRENGPELGITIADEEVAAPRRGMSKKEAERIEQQRKYREAMGKSPIAPTPKPGPEAGAAPRKVPRESRLPASEFFAKPTPESVSQTAVEVMEDPSKLPSFKRFLDHVRSRHGDIQAGQVSEAWVDNVWKFLNNATGAQLNSLVDRLALRRQVFGKIPQGSKTFGLKGAPPTLERTGEIADPVEVETGRSMIQRALERADRLTNKAEVLEARAKGAKSRQDTIILQQQAQILRRTAEGIERGAASGEGIQLEQETLFPGIEERTSQLTGKPVPVPGKPGATKFVGKPSTVEPIVTKGSQLRARDRAIAIIGAHLINQRSPMDSSLKRKTLGPEDIRWHELGSDIVIVAPEDLEDLDNLGMALTKGAGVDASTKRIAGGGRFVVQEKALPRSATKRIVELSDRKTGKVYLVDGYRDSKRGPVFLDPGSVTGEHRTLEQLIERYQPVRSFPLDKPVQSFFQKFDSKEEYNDKFWNRVKEMEKEVGLRGYDAGAEHVPIEQVMSEIEGGEGVEGEGGFVQGPAAGIVRAELGMVRGARDLGIDIAPNEARQLYREFRFLESGADAEQLFSRLRRRFEKRIMRGQDWSLISAIAKVHNALSEKGSQRYEDTLNEIYSLTQRIEKESAFAKSIPARYEQESRIPDTGERTAEQGPSPFERELTMPIERVPPTLVRPEQLPPYSKPIKTKPAPSPEIGKLGGTQFEERERPRTEKDVRMAERRARYAILREELGRKPTEEEIDMAARLQEQKRVRAQADANRFSNRLVRQVTEATVEDSPTDQGELFALRRMSQQPDFWKTDKWRQSVRWINTNLDEINVGLKDAGADELAAFRLRLSGLNQTIRTIIRDTGLKLDEDGITPIWDTVMKDRFEPASALMDSLEQAETIEKKFPQDLDLGALRRRSPRTVTEAMSNLVNDPFSIYDRWMTERVEEYGGTKARRLASIFRSIISREKQIYGMLTPLLDRARRLAGGIDPGQASSLRASIGEIPGRIKGSANAVRSGVWLNKLNRINEHAATANSVDAIEGNIAVPSFATDVVNAARAANMEIGRLLERVVPNFRASGLFQRNFTALGYDIIRSGGGDLWERWTKGMADANRLHGATTYTVREHFKSVKKILDNPLITATDMESVNQDMARHYPAAVTHVRQFGRWIPVVHSDLFNYLETAARRATHVTAFREQFPNTDQGRSEFKKTMEDVSAELPAEIQRDLSALVRSMHGHPTDDYNSDWLDMVRLNPQQAGGALLRGLNQTINNLAAKAVLTGQMFVQPGEVIAGSTPVFLGYENYLKALAQLRHLYKTLELEGSVNRVMSDYTFNPHAPFKSAFRIAGNLVAKGSMQNALNEFQEAAAAATARVVSENIITGNMSAFEEATLPHTFSMMGFSDVDIAAMMQGDPELLGQFQRKAAAWLTGGNKAIAEGSRPSTSRLFNSVFRFQTYPMIKMNQARRLMVNWVDAIESRDAKRIAIASGMAGRFLFGNTMQGAITMGLVTLAYAGREGFKIRWEEMKDEPISFASEAMLSSMSGPLYLLFRGAKQNGLTGVGEQATRTMFPYAIMNDLNDMAQSQGQYRDTDTIQKIGRFLASKTPMTRAIGTGLAMSGLGNPSQPLDVSIQGLNRWKRDQFGYDEVKMFRKQDEMEKFRTHIRNAISAMKAGDEEKYTEEWMAAVDADNIESVSRSLRARKVLEGPNGRKLTEEETDALKKRIGFDAYERLEAFDLMLESAASGAIPSMR